MISSEKIKVAQVGVANFGGFRRERLRECGLFDLVAAYDVNSAALAACVAEDGARSMGSYDELLETPDIEAVIICSGGKDHADHMVRAMEKGLHVFVEKPLCSTPEEVELLLETQRRTGRVVAVGHADHSTCRTSRTTKDLIDSGALGTIATFEKTTAHSGGLKIQPGDWRGDAAKNPGGMLFQCGVHGFHELMYYFGPITEVSALMRYDVHTTGTADVAICHFQFASGLVGTLNAYHVTPYRHTLSLYGTKANLYRNERYFSEGTSLQLQKVSGVNGVEPLESVPLIGEEDLCGNLRNFHRAIRQGGECYPSLQDGARAVQVVFAAEESARTRRVVKIPEGLE
jgi:predicted dehydrogenase